MSTVVLASFLLSIVLFQISCKNSADVSNKFVGQWKFYAVYPEDNKDNSSLNGIICGLEKYENTEETFVFHISTGRDAILSIQDANTLVGQNAKLSLKYVEDTGHLILVEHEDGSGLEFSKLK